MKLEELIKDRIIEILKTYTGDEKDLMIGELLWVLENIENLEYLEKLEKFDKDECIKTIKKIIFSKKFFDYISNELKSGRSVNLENSIKFEISDDLNAKFVLAREILN